MPKKITSSDYWRRRETRQRRKNKKNQASYDRRLKEIYRKAMADVQKEIDSFYIRYAKKEGITLSEAKKRAKKLDIEEYAEKAKRYVRTKDFSDEANEEMRLYNLTMKVNRLELLKARIGLELVDNFNDMQQFFEEKLTEQAIEEFERMAGILGETVTDADPAGRAKVLVNASFQNATWSDRIWMYQDLLKYELDKLLRTGLIQGRNPNALAGELRKVFDISRHHAERLMRTELRRVQTEAQKESFEANGFDHYEFICCGGGAGTNPNDPCPICKSLDGKVFKVKDMMIGENAPPVHPNCHCSTAAHFMDRETFDKWLDAKEKGETDLGVKEWEKRNENVRKNSSTTGSNNDKMKTSNNQMSMNLRFFGSGKDRRDDYGQYWTRESLYETIDKFVPGATGRYNSKGNKVIFNNGLSIRQIVYDIEGKYFRIENLGRTGRRRYDDINGNDVANITENGKTRGRSKKEFESLTHFLVKAGDFYERQILNGTIK